MKIGKTLIAGYILLSIGILILFTVPAAQDKIYDSSFVLYLVLSIVSYPFSLAGSILMTMSLLAVGKVNRGIIVLGILVSVFGGILWLVAVFMSLGPYDDCSGFYVGALVLSILAGLLGGFIIGLGSPGKKKEEADEQG